MKFIYKYGFLALFLAVICIYLSYWLSSSRSENRLLTKASARLTTRLNNIQTDWTRQFPDTFLMRLMLNENARWNDVSQLKNSPVYAEFFKNDSAIFWNQNKVIVDSVADRETDWHLRHTHLGYFLEKLHVLPFTDSGIFKAELLLPLRFDYGPEVSNSYLVPQFAGIWSLPDYFLVSDSANGISVPVKNINGDILYYLSIDDGLLKSSASVAALILFGLGLIFLLISGYQFIRAIDGRYAGLWKFLLLLLIAGGSIAVLAIKSLLPVRVSSWKIFDPSLFASTGVATSLGGLAIQLFVLLWALLLPVYDDLVIKKRDSNSMVVLLLQIVGNILIVFATLFSVNMIQVLVRDSKIQFSFLNPLNPDWFSILGVLCIALVLLNLWLFAWRIQNVFRLNIPQTIDQVIVLLISISLGFSYCLFSEIGLIGLAVLLWTIPFTLLVKSTHSSHLLTVRFSQLFIMIVFMTASGSAILSKYGNQKAQDTQIAYAKKLIRTRDNLTEFLVENMGARIANDSVVQRYFLHAPHDAKKMEDYLRKTYFREGFSQYNIRFFELNNEDIMLNYSDEDNGASFVSVPTLQRSMNPLSKNQLYYDFTPSGEINYLAAYPIMKRDSLVGKLYAELTVNSYKQSEVYPALLLEEKDKLPPTVFKYSYGIYNGTHLVDQSGSYSYDYQLPWKPDPNVNPQPVSESNYQHLIYRATPDLTVVVTNRNDIFLNLFSYFSFLFVIMFLLVLSMLLILIITRSHSWWKFSRLFRMASMRSLIHTVLMVFIIMSILLIGYFSAQTILRQFRELEKNGAVENMSRLNETLQTYLNNNTADSVRYNDINGWLKKSVARIANIQDVDVNFYDHSGELIASSQPSIFERGYISRKIDPVAFAEMKLQGASPFIQEEKIGSLSFLSAYQAYHFTNAHGNSSVYIQLPYFESQQDLNEESGLFFVTLINVLVIAMIVAGIAAPFIVRQVTNRLSVIGEQFKNVKVGATNELIKWNANDEIGGLVDSYNKMIRQLEESANRLARSERETAWREMARQVAHEIKNPLTPMKLSIQYLMRAREKNTENIDAMIDRVSKTMIEQIDHLSQIATEFSNFAKMPHGELKPVNVHEVLQSTCELYSKQEHISLHLNLSASDSEVMADKNYLLSVFNNLVLNAIQAIPDHKRGFVNVNTSNINHSIIVSVSDNGVGISEEEGYRVFVPNFTTKSSGTGLGLAITKSIVEQYGGSIAFQSKKYEGTTFFVKLPLTPVSENGEEERLS